MTDPFSRHSAAYHAALGEQCKDHADEVIRLLESLTGGNWQECLDVARAQYDCTSSDLWIAVIQSLQMIIRHEKEYTDLIPKAVEYDEDDLPW